MYVPMQPIHIHSQTRFLRSDSKHRLSVFTITSNEMLLHSQYLNAIACAIVHIMILEQINCLEVVYVLSCERCELADQGETES